MVRALKILPIIGDCSSLLSATETVSGMRGDCNVDENVNRLWSLDFGDSSTYMREREKKTSQDIPETPSLPP